jgi:sigma-B regulation protein RsbU (phosphoserine phosphatase)
VERFITFFIMIFDPINHKFTYVNAGHNPPFLFRENRTDINELMASGLPLGMVEEEQFEAHQIDLQHGDTLVLYTDGVTEAANKKLQQYGEKKLRECVFRNLETTSDTIKDCIVRDVRGFVGNNPMSDDLTLLVLKRDAEASSDL